MKLERDLSDRNGAALGAAELASKFGEGSGLDPRVAVETLCRALAGKNRQMYAQMEEYSKLTKVCAPPSARGKAPRREPRAFWRSRRRRDGVRERRRMDERLNGYGDAGTDVWVFGNPKGGKRARSEKNRDADTNAFASRSLPGLGARGRLVRR